MIPNKRFFVLLLLLSVGYVLMNSPLRTHVPGEIVVVGERAAQNMAFQELSPEFGKVELVCLVKGRDLMVRSVMNA